MRNNFLIALAIASLAASCKKEDKQSVQLPDNDAAFVEKARMWFDRANAGQMHQASGVLDSRQKLSKTADWQRSELGKRDENRVLSIPIKYEKPIHLVPYDGAPKLSLEQFSKLLISQEGGQFRAEVVTYLPDRDCLAGDGSQFTGIMLVEDWQGRPLGKYLINKEGRFRFTGKANPSSARTATNDCVTIHWFICDYNPDNGTTYNCEFLYSQTIGSCNESLEPCGEGCGSGESVEYSATAIQGISDDLPSRTRSTPSIDTETGDEVGQDLYIWKCGKGSSVVFSTAYNWIYYSYDLGMMRRPNSNAQWQYDDVIHQSIERIGLTPPTHEYTHSLAAFLKLISPDKKTCAVKVYFVVHERVFNTSQTRSWQETGHSTLVAN